MQRRRQRREATVLLVDLVLAVPFFGAVLAVRGPAAAGLEPFEMAQLWPLVHQQTLVVVAVLPTPKPASPSSSGSFQQFVIFV